MTLIRKLSPLNKDEFTDVVRLVALYSTSAQMRSVFLKHLSFIASYTDRSSCLMGLSYNTVLQIIRIYAS